MSLVKFKEVKETWGSEYVITDGKYKGYRISTKTIVQRIYPLDKDDDTGLPRFKVSQNTVIRVLPPEDAK